MAELTRTTRGRRFRNFQLPLCELHAIMNDYALVGMECRGSRCRRRRFLASGGWLDFSPESTDSMVFLPLSSLIEDDDGEPTKKPRPRQVRLLRPKCPWCSKRLSPVRDDPFRRSDLERLRRVVAS